MTQKNVGTIVQVIGPVLDIRFANDADAAAAQRH